MSCYSNLFVRASGADHIYSTSRVMVAAASGGPFITLQPSLRAWLWDTGLHLATTKAHPHYPEEKTKAGGLVAHHKSCFNDETLVRSTSVKCLTPCAPTLPLLHHAVTDTKTRPGRRHGVCSDPAALPFLLCFREPTCSVSVWGLPVWKSVPVKTS